ncbi:peptide chain release factor 1 [Candidatus Tremblaya phenacola PAVE]|nr:peptide chain release factor 1 [Candidatus Tremblaya phenacola PAVE]
MLLRLELKREASEKACCAVAFGLEEGQLIVKEQHNVSKLLVGLMKIERCSLNWGIVSGWLDTMPSAFNTKVRLVISSELLRLEKEVGCLRQRLVSDRTEKEEGEVVFIEIAVGVGGQESVAFSQDLSKMYCRFASQKGWEVKLISGSFDGNDSKAVVLRLEGAGIFSWLRFESGNHRVQRIPSNETKGRVHTSVCRVAVLQKENSTTEALNPSDLRIDTFRASGAGGQHVNKTDSAVRITHLPTGIVVQCQNDRSQHRNKSNAVEALTTKIRLLNKEKAEGAAQTKKQKLFGSGIRPEKIRTYNFPQQRVTDHRLNRTFPQLPEILLGNLSPIISQLMLLRPE